MATLGVVHPALDETLHEILSPGLSGVAGANTYGGGPDIPVTGLPFRYQVYVKGPGPEVVAAKLPLCPLHIGPGSDILTLIVVGALTETVILLLVAEDDVMQEAVDDITTCTTSPLLRVDLVNVLAVPLVTVVPLTRQL